MYIAKNNTASNAPFPLFPNANEILPYPKAKLCKETTRHPKVSPYPKAKPRNTKIPPYPKGKSYARKTTQRQKSNAILLES